ncbi:cell wall metabolism sensor histidine kinase WalK [Nonomuraea sp. NEAU-A123]|uniref:sensor histidine kinase n=1 Tax=Nonomuraea sp. NEAU-A123 TaxID=2839649 RepID=UPI002032A972|nr:ATP-binding protein [Nonomuraea sp. NEAU-A123]
MVSLRRDWSVRTRMTLLSSVVMALLCAIFCWAILGGAHDHATDDQADRILAADLRAVRYILQDSIPPVLPDPDVAAIQVIDSTGRVVAANERMAGQPRMASFSLPGENLRADRVVCTVPGFPGKCLIVEAIKIHKDGTEYIVYGADPVIPWYVDRSLLAKLLIGSVLLVGATAIGAYRTVSKTLDPVDAISAELAEITLTDLGRRVPVPDHHDEIRKLAEAANRTLDRLEAAVEQQRRFATDASHDLRSPITAMRTQVEEALLHPDDADWPAMTRALLASLDRLEAIVIDLLVLARLDAGAKRADDCVNLSQLIESELGRRALQVRIVTNLQPGVVLSGDRLQLGRLLTNLLDNAARHATSSVAVSVRREGDEAVLEVNDDGPGIPPDLREFVFQRFTRLDAARSKDTGGTGLGLAIAREIAERHGGTLTIEDSERGARFVLKIPIGAAGAD